MSSADVITQIEDGGVEPWLVAAVDVAHGRPLARSYF